MNILPAIMRTGVPILYAVLIRLGLGHALVALGMPADSTTTVATTVATVVLTLALYLALRLLERFEPKIGVLLGWIGAPQYGTAIESLDAKAQPVVLAALGAELAKIKAEIVSEVTAAVTPVPATLDTTDVDASASQAMVVTASPAKKAPARKPAAKKAPAKKAAATRTKPSPDRASQKA